MKYIAIIVVGVLVVIMMTPILKNWAGRFNKNMDEMTEELEKDVDETPENKSSDRKGSNGSIDEGR